MKSGVVGGVVPEGLTMEPNGEATRGAAAGDAADAAGDVHPIPGDSGAPHKTS